MVGCATLSHHLGPDLSMRHILTCFPFAEGNMEKYVPMVMEKGDVGFGAPQKRMSGSAIGQTVGVSETSSSERHGISRRDSEGLPLSATAQEQQRQQVVEQPT